MKVQLIGRLPLAMSAYTNLPNRKLQRRDRPRCHWKCAENLESVLALFWSGKNRMKRSLSAA
jgi:hypothetical protein